jgi:hypothetical protein
MCPMVVMDRAGGFPHQSPEPRATTTRPFGASRLPVANDQDGPRSVDDDATAYTIDFNARQGKAKSRWGRPAAHLSPLEQT